MLDLGRRGCTYVRSGEEEPGKAPMGSVGRRGGTYDRHGDEGRVVICSLWGGGSFLSQGVPHNPKKDKI